MIILVEGNSYRRLAIKGASFLALFLMFYIYYNHMSDKFSQENKQLETKLTKQVKVNTQNKSLAFEQTIYKESVIIVDLLNQKKVQSIKIVKDRLLLVCDYDTDIEPLLIRYGVNAYIKNTSNNIKIAIDLKTIVENKYEKA